MGDDLKFEHARLAGGAAMVTIYGLTLNEVVAVATIIYMLLQIGLLVVKYWRIFKLHKAAEECEKCGK